MKLSPYRRTTLVLLAAVGMGIAALQTAAGPEERSPFEMVRWEQEGPQVRLGGVWYELVALDGLTAARVFEACRRLDAPQWEKRFCEDLVAALATVDHDLGPTASLTLRRLDGGAEVHLEARVTAENRKRIRDARPWKRGAAAIVQRAQREHAAEPDPRFAFLTLRHHGDVTQPRLAAAQAREDLDQLEWLVEHVFAYRTLRPFDRRAAFDTIRSALGEDIAVADYHIQLRKLVALFGDGHSRVRGVMAALPAGALPFALVEADGRIVALSSSGRLKNSEHPYVGAIDGVPIEAWLAAAARLNARGSPALQRTLALPVACAATFVRRELGRPAKGPVEVTMIDAQGAEVTLHTELRQRPHRAPRYLRHEPAELDGGIGYVPIRSMWSDADAIARIVGFVRDFADAPGIVLDVRGNGGGSRDLLRALLPHLLPPEAKPVLCNVARYRLAPGSVFDPVGGNLANRSLYPVAWPGFHEAEREAVVRGLEGLVLDLPLDDRQFTPPHAMVVSPAGRDEWRVQGKIALLVDGECFSATDVFVGALEPLEQVTLIGTPTGGGSGRAKEYRLEHSDLRVRLSTMASFRPNGARYDGRGIAPDVLVPPTLSDVQGRTDSALAAAVVHLRE